MLRSELLEQLHREFPELSSKNVETLLEAVLQEITAALARGDRVELRGFGAFSVRERRPRAGRNPRTGANVAVEAKRVPFFKPGKELRERVNGPDAPRSAPAKVAPLREQHEHHH